VLERARLEHANMAGADLENANLIGADLRHASLDHANLTYANLTGAWVDTDTLRFARLCATVMPDGFVANASCDAIAGVGPHGSGGAG
jgi:uncharacterized protein YjbI with pentapeptide repeats